MNRILLSAASLAVLLALSGCETVKGVGRDITNTSDAVQQALTKKSPKNSWTDSLR